MERIKTGKGRIGKDWIGQGIELDRKVKDRIGRQNTVKHRTK